MTGLFLAVAETSVLTGLVAVLLTALLPRLRQRYAAAGRCLIWLLLTLRLLVPVPLPRPAAAPVEITLPSAAMAPLDLAGGSVPTPAVVPSTPVPAPAILPTPLELLALLWLAVAVGVLLWQLSGYVQFRRELARWAVPVEDGPAAAMLAELSAGMGLRRTPRLLLDRQGHGPLLTGLLRPAVVLPETDLPEDELRFILTHELTHYRRGDLWFRLLLLLAGSVHWFNPAVWLLRRAAVGDLELACDDAVLRTAGPDLRRAYCEAILKAVHRGKARTTLLTTSFQGGVRGMKQRFCNIFQDRKKRGLWLIVPVLALAVLLGALVSCTVAQEEAGPADLAAPVSQPNTGTHHPETHNTDHHINEYHHDEEEHHAEDHYGLPAYVEVDPDSYVEADPDLYGEPAQLEGESQVVYDGLEEYNGLPLYVEFDPEMAGDSDESDAPMLERLNEVARGFAQSYFSNDAAGAAGYLTENAPRGLYGSDIWAQAEIVAVKFSPDSFSTNSFASLQVECLLNGEDSYTYLGLELTPTGSDWLVRDFWLEK